MCYFIGVLWGPCFKSRGIGGIKMSVKEDVTTVEINKENNELIDYLEALVAFNGQTGPILYSSYPGFKVFSIGSRFLYQRNDSPIIKYRRK